MKEFKGTPGPWVVNEIGQHWNNKALTHLEITYGEDGECVCDTVYQREDANLIAAAPELLEALQRCESVLSNIPLEVCDVEDLLYARAVINKALGE